MKQSVLFVDDDASLLTGLKRMLRSMKDEWNLTFISDPSEAVQAMKNTCFDVVVTDMRMPELDGAELLAEVRNLCPHSVRIILSGQAELSTVLRAVEHAHQYISKPCDAEVLKAAISDAGKPRQVIKNHSLQELLSQLRSLPIQRECHLSLSQLLSQEAVDLNLVAETLSQDVGMTAKILQLVNSAFFTSTRTPSCKEAVHILGVPLMKRLHFEAKVFDSAVSDDSWVKALNKHAKNASTHSSSLGSTKVNGSVLSTAAMLHDVGWFVLINSKNGGTFLSSLFKDKSVASRTKSELENLERETFGATHSEVGEFLLRLWGFSEEIVLAVAGHHDLIPRSYLQEFVAFADYLAVENGGALEKALEPNTRQ